MKAKETFKNLTERLKKQTISVQLVSKLCYAILFVSTVVSVIYALVIMWGDRTGENAMKSFATALVFVFASLLILVGNNIMVKRGWWK